jgi:tetratricopeptide (TPR) repeat protein
MKISQIAACVATCGALLFSSSLLPGCRVFATRPEQTSVQQVSRATSVTSTATAQVTWSHDIAKIVYSNCTQCHHPEGAGPFSLLSYSDARRWATQMATVTQSRFMPPWLPEPGYGNFADVRRLKESDVDLILRWTKTGMAEGDPTQAPAPPHYDSTWTLGTPDLVLKVQRPLDLQAGGSDVFYNFILPYPLKASHYIRAMEILPSARQVVHHANVIIDRTGSQRSEHPKDWQNGIPGMDLIVDSGREFDPDSHFLFWKPDSPTVLEPPGMSWRLDAGNDLILNMHLKPSGKPETVEAQIGLYFTDQPPEKFPMLVQLDGDNELDVPAGDLHFVVEDSLPLPVDVAVLGIYPHAHYLGRDLEGWATLPEGRKVWLVWIRNWDIDRQSVYSYEKPIFLPKGSVLHMRYTYDNSASNIHNPNSPPIRVVAGNRSVDEMAHLWVQLLPVGTGRGSSDPRLLLEEAWMRSRLLKTPNDYISLYNLATTLSAEGKPQEAIDIFQKILSSNSNDSRAWTSLGTTTESTGDWKSAQSMYTHALSAEPGNCDARFNLGRSYLDHDSAEEAESTFRSLLANCPEDADMHSGLGLALFAEQQYENAEAEFLHALSLNPSSSSAVDLHEHLAFVCRLTGHLSEYAAELRKAVEIAPRDSTTHALLAQALAQSGKLEDAISEQKSSLLIRPDDADGWNSLGAFEAKAGKMAAARRDFQKALEIDPANSQAKKNLSILSP